MVLLGVSDLDLLGVAWLALALLSSGWGRLSLARLGLIWRGLPFLVALRSPGVPKPPPYPHLRLILALTQTISLTPPSSYPCLTLTYPYFALILALKLLSPYPSLALIPICALFLLFPYSHLT